MLSTTIAPQIDLSGVPRPPGATILVPLDGSEYALSALPVSRAIAELRHDGVHLVHITGRVVPARELQDRLGLRPEDVRGSVIDQAAGDPAEEIIRLAHEQRSRYIVMCTHTGHPYVAGTLGRVAKDVVCGAPCPVVLVPPERGRAPYSLRRVLLPHDGTPTNTAAASPAMALARRAGAELVVLHVADAQASPPTEPGSMTTPRYVDQEHHEWPAWAHEFLGRACCLSEPSPPQLRLAVAVGATGTQIAQFAREHHADLVVLDWHGSWEVQHAEAAKAVLRDAPCPVLLIRVAECE